MAGQALPSLGFLRLPRSEPGTAPYQEGASHAHELRRKFKLGSEPIASMRDFVAQHFPPIAVLYAHLTPDGPAGLTFVDKLRGATIVLNLDGKNANPCVRRFSLAHELYHVLQDWDRKEPLAILSGYLTEHGLAREQRANAFAMRLLCPQTKLRSLGPDDPAEANVEKLRDYGLHYAALRLYLRNQKNIRLPLHPPAQVVGWSTENRWSDAEEPLGVANFPLPEVPPERRTLIAQIAARLYASGKLRRGAFCDALGITPVSDVERVVDFLGFDRPDEKE
jgi:Zn-dependent peptidase ImmA (M78 family)